MRERMERHTASGAITPRPSSSTTEARVVRVVRSIIGARRAAAATAFASGGPLGAGTGRSANRGEACRSMVLGSGSY